MTYDIPVYSHGEINFSQPFKNFYTTMQYTGLKDKNGEEIYEGDILYYQYKLFRNAPDIKTTYVVKWDIDSFQGYTTRGTIGTSVRYLTKDFEIIGNIHQNPELLGD